MFLVCLRDDRNDLLDLIFNYYQLLLIINFSLPQCFISLIYCIDIFIFPTNPTLSDIANLWNTYVLNKLYGTY